MTAVTVTLYLHECCKTNPGQRNTAQPWQSAVGYLEPYGVFYVKKQKRKK